MKTIIIGLGGQGRKRLAVAGTEVVATVDPAVPDARYKTVDEVPLDSFEVALVCTPDQAKLEIVQFLLSRGKHVLVEKPLVARDDQPLRQLGALAQARGVVCYTAYNHRFEPHVAPLKRLLERRELGSLYLAKLCYGNGTALDVKRSPWRDQGLGVLSDLGSHLLDPDLFLFGQPEGGFELWSGNRFENRAFDYALFGAAGHPALVLEASLISWRNTFTLDVFGEQGSAHLQGLCKWGPSTLTVRRRVFPSGKPKDEVFTVEGPDPTWELEYRQFKELCRTGGNTLDRDLWINGVLNALGETAVEAVS